MQGSQIILRFRGENKFQRSRIIKELWLFYLKKDCEESTLLAIAISVNIFRRSQLQWVLQSQRQWKPSSLRSTANPSSWRKYQSLSLRRMKFLSRLNVLLSTPWISPSLREVIHQLRNYLQLLASKLLALLSLQAVTYSKQKLKTILWYFSR